MSKSTYLSKYRTLEQFSNSGSGHVYDETIKCYECVGEWPTRNCNPIYKEEKCTNGTFADYQSCATRCGTEFNRPDGETGEIPVEENEVEENEVEVITDNMLDNRINAAINDKLKTNLEYKGNQTTSDAYHYMELIYRKYITSLPYDVPKTYSFGMYLIVTVTLLVCNIVLTVYGVKSIGSCASHSISMVMFLTLFMILSWIGNFVPYYGNVTSMMSMIITLVLVIVASPLCR